jgi:hypothetical protein
MVSTVTERDHDTEENESRPNRRLIGATLTVLLAGAAVLWWIAGSNTTVARWISLGVIILALAGWYYSRESEPDE